MTEQYFNELHFILKKTFPLAKIPNEIESLKMGDLIEWDSLGNFNLLLEIEQHYGIRFSIDEISEIKSINAINKALAEYLNHKNG